jgi:FtsZ-interacting cell division protein ZipA
MKFIKKLFTIVIILVIIVVTLEMKLNIVDPAKSGSSEKRKDSSEDFKNITNKGGENKKNEFNNKESIIKSTRTNEKDQSSQVNTNVAQQPLQNTQQVVPNTQQVVPNTQQQVVPNTQQIDPNTQQVSNTANQSVTTQQTAVPEQNNNPSTKCPLGQVFNISKNFCEFILPDK